MEKHNNEIEWFQPFQQGNEQAFSQVYDKFYRPVSYYALKILRDDSFAEDIVSDTFQKAWDRRATFSTAKHLENFLYFVTRNACISHLRSDRTQQKTVREWEQIMDGADSPESPVDLERLQTKLIGIILEKMEELPGKDVLRMAFLEGRSTADIAIALGTTENNVYIIKSRSLKLLRSKLTNLEWLFFVLLFLKF